MKNCYNASMLVAPWRKAILALAVLPVFLFPSVGFLHFGTDSMGGQMGNCPFGGHSMVICEMNPMEHIQEWQSMFTALPLETALTLLLVLLALSVARTFSLNKYSSTSPPRAPLVYSRRTTYSFQIFNPLQEAYSSGILNPKLF
jgi:hypothetical protein